MVKIVGYTKVTVGTETIDEPIYDEPIVVVGYGDKQVIMSVTEYEAEEAKKQAEAEAELLVQQETFSDFVIS